MKPYIFLKPRINSVLYCYKEKKPCVWWVEKYFKDCLCNLVDEFSFGFGFISLLAWGIAEVPQIITNFRTKSSHGVSLLFLLTWVAGDIFNLVGCLLEPATLPTQYYTAVLYTTSTIVLVLQGLYYDHLYRWYKSRRHHMTPSKPEDDAEEKKPLNPNPTVSSIPIPSTPQCIPVRREFYYMSARYLAGSNTPPYRSTYLRIARSEPSARDLHEHSSSDDDDTATPIATRKTFTKPMPIPKPRSVAQGTMIAATVSFPIQGKGMTEVHMRFAGRRLLQEGNVEHSALGQWLGWLMAAIYMGGRFPQIILNIKRGSVEGLNPLMFVFALLANITYVLSIVVRSTEWSTIKANLPWLLDAVVCVALDVFIMLQYVYYKYWRNNNSDNDLDHEDYYVEADKGSIVS